jgi:hypothetical protein
MGWKAYMGMLMITRYKLSRCQPKAKLIQFPFPAVLLSPAYSTQAIYWLSYTRFVRGGPGLHVIMFMALQLRNLNRIVQTLSEQYRSRQWSPCPHRISTDGKPRPIAFICEFGNSDLDVSLGKSKIKILQ